MTRGFTIIELVISVGIFVFMTTLIVAKYGSFNQSTLLTDTAYDTALVIRLAQTYGLSVKNVSQAGAAVNFSTPYGVDFDSGADYCGGSSSNSGAFTLFADASPAGAPDGLCGVSDTSITSYTLAQGARVTALCAGSDATNCHTSGQAMDRISYTFVRPNPEAVICGRQSGASVCTYPYSEITLTGPDGSTRIIVVRQNGQISVQ
jgi:type II secretory pathway pseudopilin PulG